MRSHSTHPPINTKSLRTRVTLTLFYRSQYEDAIFARNAKADEHIESGDNVDAKKMLHSISTTIVTDDFPDKVSSMEEKTAEKLIVRCNKN